jgi:serine phosphatase RsbU (regulator of sigma subunit)
MALLTRPTRSTGAAPDPAARRAFLLLCVVYLILGAGHAIWFASTDLTRLIGQADATREALVTLDAQTPAPPAGVVIAATQEHHAATGAMRRGLGRAGGFLAGLGVVGWFLIFQGRRLVSQADVVAATTLMLVLAGALLLASRLVILRVIPGATAWGIADLLLLHLVACVILPWTPRESAQPFALLLVVWAVTFLVPHATSWDVLDRLVAVLVAPLVLGPGLLISAWKERSRHDRAELLRLDAQVRTIGGELSRARIVHDAMFPAPFDNGFVRFEYDYRPIAEIGGDYVHVHQCRESGRVWLTLLDVAGHGLAAALTVNRLFGELERIRAEDPTAAPGTVMALLNRYIHLTMARHSLYATGACLALDASTGELRWVSAGHPPALIRKADGTVVDLPGTTLLLGAHHPGEFDPGEQIMRINPGDVVIGFTDGAFEARNPDGRRFGLDAIRRVARFDPPPRDWARFIGNAVAEHHGGNAEDDVLVATLCWYGLRVADVPAPEERRERPVAVRT